MYVRIIRLTCFLPYITYISFPLRKKGNCPQYWRHSDRRNRTMRTYLPSCRYFVFQQWYSWTNGHRILQFFKVLPPVIDQIFLDYTAGSSLVTINWNILVSKISSEEVTKKLRQTWRQKVISSRFSKFRTHSESENEFQWFQVWLSTGLVWSKEFRYSHNWTVKILRFKTLSSSLW